MTSHSYSRIERKRSKRAIFQSFLLIFGALVFLFIFVVFLIPQVIRIYDAMTSSTVSFDDKDTIPPQLPVLDPPLPEATFSGQLVLKGYTEQDVKVALVIDGELLQEVQTSPDGFFLFDELDLSQGEYTIQITAEDANKNVSKTFEQHFTIDTETPKLEVLTPTDGTTITRRRDQTIPIEVQTEASATVTVNGRQIFVDITGKATGSYSLVEGENLLVIESKDVAGNIAKQELKVQFSP